MKHLNFPSQNQIRHSRTLFLRIQIFSFELKIFSVKIQIGP